MKRTALLLLFGAIFTQLPAQEAWPLERCIQYALEHNLDLRAKQLEVAARQTELAQKRLAWLPSISAQLGHDWNWGRSVDMQELVIVRNALTQATGASVGASIPVFSGGLLIHQHLAARKAVEVAGFEAQDLRTTLETDVTRAYLELMLAKQIHSYARESHATILQQRERTERLVEAGGQPKSALNEMEAQVAAEKATLVAAECRVRTATLSLTQLMNLPSDTAFATGEHFGPDSVVVQVPVLTNHQTEAWLLRDPRIRSAKARIAQLRYDEHAARSRFFPTLTASAAYGTFYSSTNEEPFRTQLDENRNPSVGLRLTIPIFDGWQAATQLKKSRLSLETARLTAEKIQTQVLEEIRSAGIEAENCLQQYLSSEETLQAMQNLLEITEAKYNLGAATALDYIVARNKRLKAVSDFLQAKWQYIFQLQLLERYRP